MGGKRLRLQQRRICAIYIEFCGDPTRWYIEEMHCQLLIPVWVGNGLPDLWECTFSRLYWFFQFLRACVLRLCWLFSWWGVIVATLVATYILGNCWRYFLEQFEGWRKKDPSDCYGLPTAAQISPPPHIYVRARVYKLKRLFELENLSPHLLQRSVTFDGPTPAPSYPRLRGTRGSSGN